MKTEVKKYKYKKQLRTDQKVMAWTGRLFIWLMLAVTLIPIIAVVTSSMADTKTFIQASFLPEKWTLQNYVKVIEDTDFLLWVKNSIIIATSVGLIQLVLSVPAAFAFSKLKFWGRRKGLMSLLILQMFPAAMALPAIIGIVYSWGLSNNIWVLIIILGGGSAYNIWLLKGAVDGISDELVEAAYIDGASIYRVFFSIILPLLRNMLIVIFLFAFIGGYSEFIFTSTLVKSGELKTVATGLQGFLHNKFSANWPQYSAAAIMSTLPIVVVFMLAQKYVATGLVAGGVKE